MQTDSRVDGSHAQKTIGMIALAHAIHICICTRRAWHMHANNKKCPGGEVGAINKWIHTKTKATKTDLSPSHTLLLLSFTLIRCLSRSPSHTSLYLYMSCVVCCVSLSICVPFLLSFYTLYLVRGRKRRPPCLNFGKNCRACQTGV